MAVELIKLLAVVLAMLTFSSRKKEITMPPTVFYFTINNGLAPFWRDRQKAKGQK